LATYQRSPWLTVSSTRKTRFLAIAFAAKAGGDNCDTIRKERLKNAALERSRDTFTVHTDGKAEATM
jgi:hypothetical protein